MFLEFVKGRFRKKHLEKIKEFICKEGLQGSSGFGKTGLLNKKHSYLKGKKRTLSRLVTLQCLFMVGKTQFSHMIFVSMKVIMFLHTRITKMRNNLIIKDLVPYRKCLRFLYFRD